MAICWFEFIYRYNIIIRIFVLFDIDGFYVLDLYVNKCKTGYLVLFNLYMYMYGYFFIPDFKVVFGCL